MTTPSFILDLRQKVGHDPLWLTGVTGYALDDHERLLLGRRSDTGEWALVYGINEPGEQPADTLVREIAAETGIEAEVTDLVSVISDDRMLTYANGDQAQYMDHSFLCRLLPDSPREPKPVDGENLEVGWFDPADLPQPLAASTSERITLFNHYLADKATGHPHTFFISQGQLH
ncbi:ADP-ribose pyrophosphatase [Bifidobacterium aemilianum]|uniref:ADP-ribose pyrophosphatase n=1 Tax=Bifidobacterium aemilianum TaxID=2493120 RepID=A0A366K9X6_9BIFI|nr:NUDIX domain-containing protein [Bifidobacterium aemilianum]RBP98526.1 ADP-ribose pyrophosphatase [Bifidobacterium aemilianum]